MIQNDSNLGSGLHQSIDQFAATPGPIVVSGRSHVTKQRHREEKLTVEGHPAPHHESVLCAFESSRHTSCLLSTVESSSLTSEADVTVSYYRFGDIDPEMIQKPTQFGQTRTRQAALGKAPGPLSTINHRRRRRSHAFSPDRSLSFRG